MNQEEKKCEDCTHYELSRDDFPCDECVHAYNGNEDMYIPEDKPHIKDSGARREFETGACRDIQEGKGRCDLLPLDVIGEMLDDDVLRRIDNFERDFKVIHLYVCLERFSAQRRWGIDGALLEVAKHFEEGAKKYGEYNWQKGLPIHCYIDSAVRHYLKYLRGDTDEPHDRAFVWNILCCAWTMKNKPEMNDLRKQEKENA